MKRLGYDNHQFNNKKMTIDNVKEKGRNSFLVGCGTRLFSRGFGAEPETRHAQRLQKCLAPRWHSPKKGGVRCQAINLAPLRTVPCGSRMPV